MYETIKLDDLIINKIPDKETYDVMVGMGLINEDEVYVVGLDGVVMYTPQKLTEKQKQQARANIGVGGDVIITSSTEGSTKKFKITVDDSGTITATEVTE